MDRFRRLMLTVALGASLALAACGDDAEDQVRDAGEQLQTEAEQLKTEAEDLGDSVDSEGERKARLRKLERKLEELRREGGDRADDVRREIEELRERRALANRRSPRSMSACRKLTGTVKDRVQHLSVSRPVKVFCWLGW